ncbi:MAG: hypothetical protein PHE89_03075 [Alphaproteobacteria bacterium]|nr:hypothetical protein [Alphaproteobacteria bacterium]
MKKILFSLVVLCLSFTAAEAQFGNSGVKSFQGDKDSWRRNAQEKAEILPQIRDSIGKAATKNIEESEAVFCYYVEAVSPDYNGYTVDGMAIKSFCGTLQSELRNVLVDVLLSTEENISNQQSNCIIRPRMMFRFLRGVDYTDVLLSSPCPSITLFYAGKIRAYNFTPGAAIIETLISDMNAQPLPFVSPALLGQVVPVGVAQNKKDSEIINQNKKNTAPAKSWEKNEPQKQERKGWNNLAM